MLQMTFFFVVRVVTTQFLFRKTNSSTEAIINKILSRISKASECITLGKPTATCYNDCPKSPLQLRYFNDSSPVQNQPQKVLLSSYMFSQIVLTLLIYQILLVLVLHKLLEFLAKNPGQIPGQYKLHYRSFNSCCGNSQSIANEDFIESLVA